VAAGIAISAPQFPQYGLQGLPEFFIEAGRGLAGIRRVEERFEFKPARALRFQRIFPPAEFPD